MSQRLIDNAFWRRIDPLLPKAGLLDSAGDVCDEFARNKVKIVDEYSRSGLPSCCWSQQHDAVRVDNAQRSRVGAWAACSSPTLRTGGLKGLGSVRRKEGHSCPNSRTLPTR